MYFSSSESHTQEQKEMQRVTMKNQDEELFVE